ncbi:DUF6680 family protein [Butyrivibrio sp. VCB2006]|uniref:DUF6680 family protein n=1 Tax=Butyrivibrio sp. VCB2006 TaxID=1280679 RepID=UPI000492BC53|nr:DUF6680 family protein [Butyrivibrio sp. VCB2006]
MKVLDIVNLLAIILGPIFAVVVGQKIQTIKDIRNDKVKIFKILMVTRIYPWTPETVDAFNMIDIVFADDKAVRMAWKDLYDKYCITNPDEADLIKIRNAQYKLLECMAKSLGYKDKITWEIIQNPYIPRGLQTQIESQHKNQEMYAYILNNLNFAHKKCARTLKIQ